ncbi:universal stress protein [Actinocrinis puniceicyclus]|uniref:Universal stress protein n=1 Tax=Actinocrinis puniceicyclus TaxID=977794 RepID=A0A8J8BHH0_9ACTN|nr:universal stress protein [Actinocrinis puniceicyclus]MBS2966789.1 universal stress protein [Actinocrinis puniceicyclus]
MKIDEGDEMPGTDCAPLIVVGVDGSESSIDALRWAALQAKRTDARLQAISAWQYPGGYGWVPDFSELDFEAEAQKGLDDTVARALGAEPDVPVTTRVIEGNAAIVLIDASQGADLLVVGSRGHGAFAGMLLGSVSQHCAQNASCPVLIVRHRTGNDPH